MIAILVFIYLVGLFIGYSIGEGPIEREWAAWLFALFGIFVTVMIALRLEETKDE